MYIIAEINIDILVLMCNILFLKGFLYNISVFFGQVNLCRALSKPKYLIFYKKQINECLIGIWISETLKDTITSQCGGGTVLRIRSFSISSILHTFVYALPIHSPIAQKPVDIVKKVKVSIQLMLSKTYSLISAKPGTSFPVYNNISI